MSAAQTQATIQSTRRSYTILTPQVKFALFTVQGALNVASLREALMAFLAEQGWDEAKIEREYLRYALRCRRNGKENLFPGGKV